jgi:hypothetical protein
LTGRPISHVKTSFQHTTYQPGLSSFGQQAKRPDTRDIAGREIRPKNGRIGERLSDVAVKQNETVARCFTALDLLWIGGGRLVGLSAIHFFIGPARWTDPRFELFHEPEDQTSLLTAGMATGGTFSALFSQHPIAISDF